MQTQDQTAPQQQEPGNEWMAREVRTAMRDSFAQAALQGLLSGFNANSDGHNWTHADFADEAYKMADAMLAERAKVAP